MKNLNNNYNFNIKMLNFINYIINAAFEFFIKIIKVIYLKTYIKY